MALEFDGGNDRKIDVADHADLDFTTAMTMLVLLDIHDANTLQAILGKGQMFQGAAGYHLGAYSIYIWNDGADKIWGDFYTTDNGNKARDTFSHALTTGLHFYALTFSSGTVVTYYDSDTPGGGPTTHNTINTTATSLQFGIKGQALTDEYDGIFMLAALYNRVLSEAEMRYIWFNRGIGGIVNGLMSGWYMNESPDGTAAAGANSILDISGRAHHGTPSNSPVYRAGPVRLFLRPHLATRSPALRAYSEAALKMQGNFSLKGIAKITDSLNKSLTRIVSPTKDLSGINTLYFYVRSTRTGSNIKMGIHDSGGTTTEITPNIAVANVWQLVTWDISGVADADKNDIDQIIVTIVNALAANTFYLDDFKYYDLCCGYYLCEKD